MKIFIGADHRGFSLKQRIVSFLRKEGYPLKDLGTDTDEKSCDYPQIAYRVAREVAKANSHRGILVCMSGIGQAIAANKVRGAYAALCCSREAAVLSRRHNNANILVLSAKFAKANTVNQIVKAWLESTFEGGRHLRRFNQIKKIEKGLRP